MDQRTIDIDTLARTIWAEARSDGEIGMAAVACAILNRVSRPGWWTREMGDDIPDDTVQAACRDPLQFSCWNADDPNLPKLLGVTLADPAFRLALSIATRACAGELRDDTQGSTNYHTIAAPKWAKTWPPKWTRDPKKMIPTVIRGGHQFYRAA